MTPEKLTLLKEALPTMNVQDKLQVLELLSEWERREAAKKARNSLLTFVKRINPAYKIGPHHKILAEKLEKAARGELDRLATAIAPRFGKACADNTLIYTARGLVKHGDLVVGDKVFHPSGCLQKINAVSEPVEMQYEVKISNGERFLVHGKHEWAVLKYGRVFQVIETEKLAAKKLWRGKEKGRGHRYDYSLPLINTLQTPDVELSIDPYMLGVWLGDGYESGTWISMHPSSFSIAEKLQNKGYAISAVHAHKETGVLSVSFGGVKGVGGRLHKELMTLRLFDKKHIPEVFFTAGTQQKLQLLAGLIDSDGTVEKKSGRVIFSNTNTRLIAGVEKLVRSLGWHCYTTRTEPALSSSGIQGTKPVFQVGFNPLVEMPCVLERKKNILPRKRNMFSIISIERVSSCEVGRCIEVESSDGLYLIGAKPTATHNSLLLSLYFPAWFMGNFPEQKLIISSHTADLAVDFGKKVRNLIDAKEYKEVFPGVSLAADSKSAGRWNTNKGGEFFAVGVEGAVAGRGADLLIVDDPFSEQDILNGNYGVFDKVYEWYAYGARTRLMPGGRVVVLHTRWAKNDLIGRLLEESAKNKDADQWEYTEFPAILHEGTDNEKSLWPDQWSLEALRRTRASMPTFQWQAQYQQAPTSQEGALIKREWWRLWKKEDPPTCEYIIMSLDAAQEVNKRSDFTALTTWGVFYHDIDNGKRSAAIILLNAINKRMEFPDLKDLALREYKTWKPDCFIIEKKSNGAPLAQELRRMGIPIQDYTPSRGAPGNSNTKYARVNSVADIVRSGLVWAPEYKWADEVIEQCNEFPSGKNDYLVDTAVMALMRFRSGGFIVLPSDEDDDEPQFMPRRSVAYY